MKRRIVFLTRGPIVHQMGGSTTCALNLLELLARQGADVTVLVTSAAGRSPLMWFRPRVPLPRGVAFLAPGYTRLGPRYVLPFSGKAWARTLSRAAVRLPMLRPLMRAVERSYGDALYTNAWDLTEPTATERSMALREIARLGAETVVANYAHWGPLLADPALAGVRRVILMHDLLSARVASFRRGGAPLDCPPIDEATEMRWLSSADAVLAAQQREAEFIQPRITAKALVQPIVLEPQPSAREPEPGRCLLVGANHAPNQAGLVWLLREVWPRVLAANPNATLAVAGTLCESIAGNEPSVLKLGVVPSLAEEYARAAVCVVPLRIGSGIKIKLIEALSFGKATVSTSVGIQGLEHWATGAVAVADGPEDFAAAILSLLSDPELRRNTERAALQLVRDHFSAGRELAPEFIAALF